MAVAANSYGAASDVSALTELYCISGAYTTATIPTLAQVEGWIDQVSAVMNAALAAQGFAIPITNTDSVLAIKSFIIQAVVDLAHAANSAGRYFTDAALTRGDSPMVSIRREIMSWVEMFADGLGALGATRTGTTGAGEIGFRGTDNAGNDTSPIFQRGAFGNTFQDWDT